MIADPFVNTILKCDAIEKEQQHLQLPLCLVTVVRPEAMSTTGDAQRAGQTIQIS